MPSIHDLQNEQADRTKKAHRVTYVDGSGNSVDPATEAKQDDIITAINNSGSGSGGSGSEEMKALNSKIPVIHKTANGGILTEIKEDVSIVANSALETTSTVQNKTTDAVLVSNRLNGINNWNNFVDNHII